MKNLNKYGVIEINKIESSQINGGGDSWLYKLGAAAKRTCCEMVDNYTKYYHTTYI